MVFLVLYESLNHYWHQLYFVIDDHFHNLVIVK